MANSNSSSNSSDTTHALVSWRTSFDEEQAALRRATGDYVDSVQALVQAVEVGSEQVRELAAKALDLEYALLGDCRHTGSLLDALGVGGGAGGEGSAAHACQPGGHPRSPAGGR